MADPVMQSSIRTGVPLLHLMSVAHSPPRPELSSRDVGPGKEQKLRLSSSSMGSGQDSPPGWTGVPALGHRWAGSCRTGREGGKEGSINQEEVESCFGPRRQEKAVPAEGTARGRKEGPCRRDGKDTGHRPEGEHGSVRDCEGVGQG